MYTRCWRCDWLAYGRLDALHVAERIHRDLHQERIRRRAYDLYEQRGKEDGRDVEDWFRAEEEITFNGHGKLVGCGLPEAGKLALHRG